MKSAIALNPEIKFSSFLKKIPKNVNNPIDKIIQEKNNKNVNDNINSDKQNSEKLLGDKHTNVGKEILGESINNGAVKDKETDNPNEFQYFEREISTEEEAKLRSALTNHFIFQDLTGEIM